MEGKAVVGQKHVKIQCALHMYEADILGKAILYNKLLADQNFIVHPRRHGLYFQDKNLEIFESGHQGEDKRPSARLDKVDAIHLQEVPIGIIPSDPLDPTFAPPANRKGKERAPYPQSGIYSESDIRETITETQSLHRGYPRGKTANPATSSTSVPPGRLSLKLPSPLISRPGSPTHLLEQGEDDFGETTRV